MNKEVRIDSEDDYDNDDGTDEGGDALTAAVVLMIITGNSFEHLLFEMYSGEFIT